MTVINRKHFFVYLKSRKTAGTAVEMHLLGKTQLGGDIWHTAQEAGQQGIAFRRRPLILGAIGSRLFASRELAQRYLWRYRIEEHHTAEDLARLLGSFWTRALKVTSIRNPWDLMVSAWAWRKGGRNGTSAPIGATFDEWARACIGEDIEWRERVQGYDPKILIHPFVYVNGVNSIDFVIRQESISHDLDKLGQKLGITIPAIDVKTKVSERRKDYRFYYNDELCDAIARYFSDIITEFGYTFH